MRLRQLCAILALTSSLLAGSAGGASAAPALRAEPSKVVSNYTFSMPHAHFTLFSGQVARVFSGQTCVGFCFQGRGSLDYTTQLATEFTVMKANLAHNGCALPSEGKDGLHTGTSFQKAMFWIGGRDVEPFAGADGAPMDDTLQSLRTRFGSGGIASGLTAALSYDSNKRPLPYVRADLDGDIPFIYELDPYHTRFESLYLLSSKNLQDPLLKGYLRYVTLSQQPVGWDLHQPVLGEYMLRAVTLDLTQTAPLQGTLKVKETIQPLFNPIKSIRMYLDRDHWGNNGTGLVLHHETVTKVVDGEGHALAFTQDAWEITIELPTVAAPNSKVELAFDILGDFLVPPTNGNFWQLGTSAWFPQPDLNGQMYTWDATIRVKKPWLAFSCGDTVRRWEDGGYNAVETRSDVPIAFGVMLAGDYSIQRETRDGLTVEVATYGSKAQFSKALLDMSFPIIKYYQAFLGPYPYKEFHILEKNEWGYGQAPASIMFITKEAFNQTNGLLNRYLAEGVRGRFVHEIAHQWWGCVVKMPSYHEQWITESFADMCASLCLEDWPQGHAKSEYVKLIAHWKSEAAYATDKGTIPTCNYNDNPDNSQENILVRTGLLYNKGAWLLYCIRKEIGDQEFLTFLKSYQTNFKWKFGTTRDVVGLLSFITKKDWNPWFEKYYWGTGLPDAKE